MADKYRMSLPASFFIGDQNTIIEAGDLPAVPASPSGRSSMKFDDGADEHAMVSKSFSIPDANIWTNGSGTKLFIHYFGDAAGGGGSVVLDAAFECITEGDPHDMHATADAFAAHQSVTDAVDANAGRENVAVITFNQAQADAIAAGDGTRICIRRDSADGSDDYADSIWITHVDLYEVTV